MTIIDRSPWTGVITDHDGNIINDQAATHDGDAYIAVCRANLIREVLVDVDHDGQPIRVTAIRTEDLKDPPPYSVIELENTANDFGGPLNALRIAQAMADGLNADKDTQ